MKVAISAAALLLAGALYGAQAPQPIAQPAPYTYHGTVQAVRVRPPSLEMVTGVGMALRVVRMSVASDTRITAGDQRLALADLKPGDRVRAECRLTRSGLVADRIERQGLAQ